MVGEHMKFYRPLCVCRYTQVSLSGSAQRKFLAVCVARKRGDFLPLPATVV